MWKGSRKSKLLIMNKEKELLELCKSFINEQQITCAESVWQSDRVIENAYELIEKICNICGYYEYKEDEE